MIPSNFIRKSQAHGGLHYVNLNLENLDLPPPSPSRMALLQSAGLATPSIADESLASPAVDSSGTAFTYGIVFYR